MSKRTKPDREDRIVNTTTGETGTVIDVHTETKPKGSPPNFTVLPDTGKRMAVLWLGHEVEVHLGKARDCKRCGAKNHNAINCDKGDMP